MTNRRFFLLWVVSTIVPRPRCSVRRKDCGQWMSKPLNYPQASSLIIPIQQNGPSNCPDRYYLFQKCTILPHCYLGNWKFLWPIKSCYFCNWSVMRRLFVSMAGCWAIYRSISLVRVGTESSTNNLSIYWNRNSLLLLTDWKSSRKLTGCFENKNTWGSSNWVTKSRGGKLHTLPPPVFPLSASPPLTFPINTEADPCNKT